MMWMMGYNDGGEVDRIQDPLSSRRLRPLMPRPANTDSTTTAPCLARFHGNDLLALNHHLAAMAEQGKRDLLNTQQVVVTSRWNPTPEQLQTLEELYRWGTRTPSAEQIQQITAQLRRYGKIEGKNVFYWFQNHKARERQKRRRQIDEQQQQQQQETPQSLNTNQAERREAAGSNRPVAEVEQTRNWASPTNSSTAAEQTVSPQGEGPSKADSKADDGWLHFDDAEEEEEEEDTELLQQQRRHVTWQMMHLSPANMIINNSSASPQAMGKSETEVNQKDFIAILSSSLRGRGEATETLELFPLRSGGTRPDAEEEEEEESGGALNDSSEIANPYQFFEFLPLKN